MLRVAPRIVSYSDIFYKENAVIDLINDSSVMAVTYDPYWFDLWSQRFEDPLDDAESFRINDESFLLEIGRKAFNAKEIQGQYMGLLKISPEAWQIIKIIRSGLPKIENDKMHMTHLLQKMIDDHGVAIRAVPYHGEWGEVDSELDLNFYQNNF